MEPVRIKELLNKYWQAETTDEEEAELREYYSKNEGEAGALFNYFQEEKNVSLPAGFEARSTFVTRKENNPVKWMYPLLKVSAVLLVVFSVIYLLTPKHKNDAVALVEKDTYNDPEQQAYLETRKALLLISNHLNAGKNYIDEVGKLNKAEELIHSKTN